MSTKIVSNEILRMLAKKLKEEIGFVNAFKFIVLFSPPTRDIW